MRAVEQAQAGKSPRAVIRASGFSPALIHSREPLKLELRLALYTSRMLRIYLTSIPSIKSSLPDITSTSPLPHLVHRNSQFPTSNEFSQALQQARTGIVSICISAFSAAVCCATIAKQNLKEFGTMPVRTPTLILMLTTCCTPHLSTSPFTISKILLAMDISCIKVFSSHFRTSCISASSRSLYSDFKTSWICAS